MPTANNKRRRRFKNGPKSPTRFPEEAKKSLCAAERHRADVARARRRWIRQQGFLDTTRLVFIDETAITTNMVRVRGRCPRGERLVSHVPLGEWKTITFIAGLRHNRMTAPMVIEGAMNG